MAVASTVRASLQVASEQSGWLVELPHAVASVLSRANFHT